MSASLYIYRAGRVLVPGGGGGGLGVGVGWDTPLHKLYRYVQHQRVWFWGHFGQK